MTRSIATILMLGLILSAFGNVHALTWYEETYSGQQRVDAWNDKVDRFEFGFDFSELNRAPLKTDSTLILSMDVVDGVKYDWIEAYIELTVESNDREKESIQAELWYQALNGNLGGINFFNLDEVSLGDEMASGSITLRYTLNETALSLWNTNGGAGMFRVTATDANDYQNDFVISKVKMSVLADTPEPGTSPVPEPATVLLLFAGFAWVLVLKRWGWR